MFNYQISTEEEDYIPIYQCIQDYEDKSLGVINTIYSGSGQKLFYGPLKTDIISSKKELPPDYFKVIGRSRGAFIDPEIIRVNKLVKEDKSLTTLISTTKGVEPSRIEFIFIEKEVKYIPIWDDIKNWIKNRKRRG